MMEPSQLSGTSFSSIIHTTTESFNDSRHYLSQASNSPVSSIDTRSTISSECSSLSSQELPSVEEMNPFANGEHYFSSSGRGESKRAWSPVSDLIPTKESMYLRKQVGNIVKRVHQEISPTELEVRANTPQYKVVENDWVAHGANNQYALIRPLKTVARLPADLIISDENTSTSVTSNDISGFLCKRGEKNKAFKQRYMELRGTILSYYKRKPGGWRTEKLRGEIDLDRVSSLQPMDRSDREFGILLVTPRRTWSLAAENEEDYTNWAKALSSAVKFKAVHVTYRRMFLLQEVSAQRVTDVRMVIATGDTVGDIVEHIFNCYKQALDAAPLKPYDPTKYVLKITGYRDYLIDRYRPMNEYMYVRECLLTHKTIQLTVIHESVVQEAAKLGRTNFSTLAWGYSHTSGDWSNGNSSINESFLDLTSSLGSANNLGTTPSLTVDVPLHIVIRRLLNVPNHYCLLKRGKEESQIERIRLNSHDVMIRLELFDNGALLDGCAFDTPITRLKSQRQNKLMTAEWTNPIEITFSNVPITLLSRSTRLQLSLLAVKKNLSTNVSSPEMQEEKLLVTGINIFEVDGLLTSGTQYVGMYNNLHSCVQGPIPHAVYPNQPVVHLEFPTFVSPVKFDWSGIERPESLHDRIATISIAAQREQSLRKEGWLKKLGSIKFTSWRLRYFVLDQATCTLSYADDQTAPKKEIPLKGCTVSLANEMNEVYTTCPVNSGTRKERHTYCFKVKPQNTSREYFLSAISKQERDHWMIAIRIVAQTVPGEMQLNLTPDRRSMAIADTTIDTAFPNMSMGDEGKTILNLIANERSSLGKSGLDSSLENLRSLIINDPLYRLGKYQKTQLWENREEFMDIFAALPQLLTCVNWIDPEEIAIIMDLLPKWSSPDHPAAYIILLNGEFSHVGVREFAVKKLALMADATFSYFLPQLVQAIKFENHHVSALSTMLIERAIKNPNQIGFDLFWAMKVEAHNLQFHERYGEILNAYLDVCSHKMREILKLQDKLFAAEGRFEKICQTVKSKKKDGAAEMKRVLHEALNVLNRELPSSFQLPLDPRCEVGKIIVHKCKVMDSAKKPLWLVFENAEEGGDPVTVMFKAGDDVRQDCLTLQLIRLMDEMWRDEGLDLAMEPYKCVATSPMTGILQIVMNSITTAEVHKRANGRMGAFSDDSFLSWIKSNNPDKKSFKAAVDIFMRSCAGYCVATGVLGIGDRHNDNIMITAGGRYFHIDFGHFLGHLKYHMGVKRERTPFVFTKEMAYVFGGTGTQEFEEFVNTACRAYSVVRRHMHLLSWLLIVMIPADMPELTGRDDINYIVDFIAPELTEEKALSNFTSLIFNAIQDTSKRFDNTIHILAH